LKRTGAIAAVGGALVGTVGVAGFAAYTTVTSVIAATVGIVGLTLPFAVYLHVTAAPWRRPLCGEEGELTDARRLVPVMVATAVMGTVIGEEHARRAATLSDLLAKYHRYRSTNDLKTGVEISNTFPCLVKVK
jgi:hypothetical protein